MLEKQDLIKILNELRNLPSETEWCEFKTANDNFSTNEIGKYFSALSNEANILDKNFAWVIFGIDDKTHNIVGTDYRKETKRLKNLKEQIGKETTNRHSFIEIHELIIENKRIIMFQIPPAPISIPIAWKGHYYGREHESIAPLSTVKYEKIRNQKRYDWSAQIIEEATIKDLDIKAIEFARKKFKEGNERKDFYDEIDKWDNLTFLNKARLTIDGKFTNTTLLLLGKPEAKRFLFANARITYIYINEKGEKENYEHFDPPFILERDNLLKILKNKDSKFKILPSNETLNPTETFRYDNWTILEALNNCIAHQDYTKEDKIIVTEKANYELSFKNSGSFFYGTIEDYIFLDDFTPPDYRNSFLAEAMEKIGMIDTIGSGIKRMFNKQKERYLPLPDYILSNYVELTIFGDNIANEYTKQLYENKNLNTGLVFLLDKKQKGFSTTNNDYKYVIISFLKQQRRASRKNIDELLFPYFENKLSDKQKKAKVSKILLSLSRNNKIKNISNSTKQPVWTLF